MHLCHLGFVSAGRAAVARLQHLATIPPIAHCRPVERSCLRSVRELGPEPANSHLATRNWVRRPRDVPTEKWQRNAPIARWAHHDGHSRRHRGLVATSRCWQLAEYYNQERSTLLADAPRRYAAYAPENFDRGFLGPVFARDALIHSRNVPAVTVLVARLGVPRFRDWLAEAGLARLRPAGELGLALALGAGEATMEELVRLYALLANGGVWASCAPWPTNRVGRRTGRGRGSPCRWQRRTPTLRRNTASGRGRETGRGRAGRHGDPAAGQSLRGGAGDRGAAAHGRLPAPAEGVRVFLGLSRAARAGAVIRRIGTLAEALPSDADLRRLVGLVAHVYSTPLSEVMAMELRDLFPWANAAAVLLRETRGQ